MSVTVRLRLAEPGVPGAVQLKVGDPLFCETGLPILAVQAYPAIEPSGSLAVTVYGVA